MARIEKRSLDSRHFQQRSWGHEHWIENKEYCGKLLHINAYCYGSMHYHLKKSETMYVSKGSIAINMIDRETGEEYKIDMNEGDSVFIGCGQAHQIIANSEMDSEIIEFSTFHSELDSYRLRVGLS